MSYYMGDYYQGDYYQGDPFLGGLVALGAGFVGKKLLGRGAMAAGKSLVRRGIAAIARPTTARIITAAATGASVAGAVRSVAATAAPPSLSGMMPMPRGIAIPGTGTTMIPSQMFPGGKPGLVATQRPAGYHWSRKAGKWVKNRRMNVTNARALRRSIRRATGFAKLARRVLTFVSPRAPRGKAVYRKKARR